MITQDPLNAVLDQRDELVANSPEFADLETIESEEIRELGRIVLETTSEDTTSFSTT